VPCCAIVYQNEEEVGLALKNTALPRSAVWVTTKWSGIDGKGCKQSIQESLSKLGLDYVDLYLIHSPRVANGDIPGAWREMEEVKKMGWAKSIGVSK
jgi:diketogulonate reductase-like aldo/keto reductase